MDVLSHLLLGLQTALSLQNLVFAFLGAVLGTLVGVLPGLGPVAMLAMLMPALHGLQTTPALILLAGVYYGAQYGVSTAAILVDRPGEEASAVTAIDGYQMARQGRAGAALATAALGSFFAGCVGTAIIAALAPPLTELAFRFGPAEYFSLIVLGLVGVVVLAPGSLVKAIAMVVLGLLLGQVGTDPLSGTSRFNFDLPQLADGIGFIVVAIGLFGLGEIIVRLGQPPLHRVVCTRKTGPLWPTKEDFSEAWPSVLRGTTLGSLLGLLPGGGALLASVASYLLEKKAVLHPRIPFGKGAIQGVGGPESANNAGAQAAFLPMLSLGIPPNAVMALMLGALAMKGIQPGPQVMTAHPALFWGLIASMWAGHLMLLVLNLPLIGLWIPLLSVPYRLVYPALVVFCCIGAWLLRQGPFDVWMAALFSVLGYALHKLGCEAAPLLLGFVLGPMMEESLRRSLLLSNGDWSILVTRPLSAGLLVAAALLMVLVGLPSIRHRRQQAFQED